MFLYAPTFWSDLRNKVRIADYLQKSDNNIKNELIKLLNITFPKNKLRIYPFGSRTIGVADNFSDWDFYIEIDNNFNDYSESTTFKDLRRQEMIANAFTSHSDWKHLSSSSGRCPIVQVLHNPTNLHCDISFSHSMAYNQNQLVKYLFDLQPIARYMVIYLRGWIKNINLQNQFRSHILILMVIFFLQLKNLLPRIDKLQEHLLPSVGPFVTKFNKLKTFYMHTIVANKRATIKMLNQFFDFYSKFDFAEYAICPFLGKNVKRMAFELQMPVRYFKMKNRDIQILRHATAVQDFIYLNENQGWRIKKSHLATFQAKCLNEVSL